PYQRAKQSKNCGRQSFFCRLQAYAKSGKLGNTSSARPWTGVYPRLARWRHYMLDIADIRRQFPSLAIRREKPIFLDGPGGTQVPRTVIEGVVGYFTLANANRGGLFATSVYSDQLLNLAHRAVAEFLNVQDPDEVIFGANMTSLTFHLSRSIALTI